jgi:hypothetical protein
MHVFVCVDDRTIESLHDNEKNLFDERIREVLKKLQPAFLGKITCIDTNTFDEFTQEANRTIDQVRFENACTCMTSIYMYITSSPI